jgi:hypothetical protein
VLERDAADELRRAVANRGRDQLGGSFPLDQLGPHGREDALQRVGLAHARGPGQLHAAAVQELLG